MGVYVNNAYPADALIFRWEKVTNRGILYVRNRFSVRRRHPAKTIINISSNKCTGSGYIYRITTGLILRWTSVDAHSVRIGINIITFTKLIKDKFLVLILWGVYLEERALAYLPQCHI